MQNKANEQEFELAFNKSQSGFKYIDRLNFESDYEGKVNNVARVACISQDTYVDFSRKIKIVKMDDGTLLETK